MSPQFQKVHHPPLLPITDQFPQHQYCQRCLSVWWRFVSDDLWNTLVCFQPPSLLIGKVWVPVMCFSVCHIHCRVHWRVGRRPGLCRSTSVLLLIRSTIREFSIGSALWVSEVLCCLYRHSSYLIDHSLFRGMDKLCSVGIGGSVLSILTQFLSNRSQQVMVDGCRNKLVNVSGVPQGSVLGPSCSSCTRRSFFPFWKIS